MSNTFYNPVTDQIAAVLDKFLSMNNISDMRLEYEKDKEDAWVATKAKIKEEAIKEVFEIVGFHNTRN